METESRGRNAGLDAPGAAVTLLAVFRHAIGGWSYQEVPGARSVTAWPGNWCASAACAA